MRLYWILFASIVLSATRVLLAAKFETSASTPPSHQESQKETQDDTLSYEIDDKHLIKPELRHPIGVEHLDPYKTENRWEKYDEADDEEDDYFFEKSLKESNHDEHHDLLPSIDVDHLLNSEHKVIFLLEPQNAYVTKSKPATLSCRAANALSVYFKCNGIRPESSQYEFVDPQSGVRIIEAECNVTHDRVEEYFGDDRFKCVCYAWTSGEEIQSQSVFVEISYIKKQFSVSPQSTLVALHGQASLRCGPPQAAPPPKIYWLKDNNPFTPDENILISDEGYLHFSQAALKDMANYTCVAENVAGKRYSEPALLTVYVDGGWSAWSPWVDCKCGSGRRKTRTCNNPAPLNGGAACNGNTVVKTPDCLPCLNAIPGRWTPWSTWSLCGRDCKKTRTRSCVGETSCNGKDVQYADCMDGFCSLIIGKEHGEIHDLMPLYIGILVAFLVFTGLAFTMLVFMKKKKRGMYSRTRDGEKTSCLQPDLMQHNKPPSYDHIGYQRRIHASEHLYDVPQLSNGYASPADQQLTPCTSAESDEYEMKAYNSAKSYSSEQNSNGSAYSRLSNKLTPPSNSIEMVHDSKWSVPRTITSSNGVLILSLRDLRDDKEVALLLPDGSSPMRSRIRLAVRTEERCQPKLAQGLTQLSPVVECSPSDITLSKPVIIEMPHCCNLSSNSWNLSVYATERRDTKNCWRKVVTVGQETLNSPVYTHLEAERVFLVTDFLAAFVLVGESQIGKCQKVITKNLKLLVFGPLAYSVGRNEYSVRIYAADDTPSAIQQCEEREKRIGGVLLDSPKPIKVKDSGKSVSVLIESDCDTYDTNYHEISCEKIWASSYNVVSFKFYEFQNKTLAFRAIIFQEETQTLEVKINSGHCETSPEYVREPHIIENPFESKTLPMYGNFNSSAGRRSLLNQMNENRNDETCGMLSRPTRMALCAAMDPPSEGFDWRSLARELGVARYLQYWAARVSPTDHVLSLWEAINRRDRQAPLQLAQIIRNLGRDDLARVIEQGNPDR